MSNNTLKYVYIKCCGCRNILKYVYIKCCGCRNILKYVYIKCCGYRNISREGNDQELLSQRGFFFHEKKKQKFGKATENMNYSCTSTVPNILAWDHHESLKTKEQITQMTSHTQK